MKLLLSRHGNTFGPGDPVVWTGSSNDLPLVEKGLAQARKLADAMIAQKVSPVAVYCSPLQRTSRYARIVIEKLELKLEPQVDPRITEIDYGEWTGLTQEQVIARFGRPALQDWDEHARWPALGGWGGSESQAISEVASFVEELKRKFPDDSMVLVVTSNGRLRYFLNLIPGEFERRAQAGTFKVKTGHVCQIVLRREGVSIPYWNIDPSPETAL